MATHGSAQRIDLLGTVSVLHEHLTTALCQGVHQQTRIRERERSLTLDWLAKFWTAVILRAPRSLTQALDEANGQPGGDYPGLETSKAAFFARCKDLSWEFFAQLFHAFQAVVSAAEPGRFAGDFKEVIERFGHVYIADGSTLDQVSRRLKILWKDRRVPMPGSVVAFYDMARGCLAALLFERTPQGKEMPCAREGLKRLPKGAFVIGDALYGIPKFFASLAEEGLFGLARFNHRAGFQAEQRLSSRAVGRGRITQWIGTSGLDQRTDSQRLRRITWREGSRKRDLLTSVLDPTQLSAEDALDLYGARWSVERMFYDLKEVLNLHCFYAANTNAVAMQVYAAALVYTALRTAQGRIAHAAGIDPEDISTEKLFPKVAAASSCLTIAEVTFKAVCKTNPGVRLKKPDWNQMPFAKASLASVLVEQRSEDRRTKRRCAAAERWRPLPRPPRRPGTAAARLATS